MTTNDRLRAALTLHDRMRELLDAAVRDPDSWPHHREEFLALQSEMNGLLPPAMDVV